MHKLSLFQCITFIFCLTMAMIAHASPLALQVGVLKPPTPVPASDSLLLVYEIHLSNPSQETYRLGRIDIYDETNQKLTSYSGDKLKHHAVIFQHHRLISTKEVDVPADSDAFVYIWIAFDNSSDAPSKLRHEIWMIGLNKGQGPVKPSLINYEIKVSQEQPVALNSPLKGYNWLANNGLGLDSSHRRAILFNEGQYYLPTRYAADWLQLCPNGCPTVSKQDANLNHDVYAATDGKVIVVQSQLMNLVSEETFGHYVVQEINQNGKNYYLLYANLLPNSIKVKTGDILKSGQAIGSVSSDGGKVPKLHFQVSEASDIFKSEGVPFVFNQTAIQGKAQLIDEQHYLWKPFAGKNQSFNNIHPLAAQIFYFDAQQMKC